MASVLRAWEDALLAPDRSRPQRRDDASADERRFLEMAEAILAGEFAAPLQGEPFGTIFARGEGDAARELREARPEVLERQVTESVRRFVGSGSEDEQALREGQALCVAIACVHLFAQGNWTGPAPALELPIPPLFVDRSGARSKEGADRVAAVRAWSVEQLERNGEQMYVKAVAPEMLLAASALLAPAASSLPLCRSAPWWAARAMFMHQRGLTEPAALLKAPVDERLRGVVQAFADAPELKARAHLELALMHSFYHRSNPVVENLDAAAAAANLHVQLTGVLGKRTKFQTFLVSQLVCQASPAQPADGAAGAGGEGEKGSLPRQLELDDWDLLPRIKLEEGGEVGKGARRGIDEELRPLDQAIVLGYCNHAKSKGAKDTQTLEEMAAYVARLETQPRNWMVHSTTLLMKTRVERARPKTVEHGTLQLQVLVEQFADKEPGAAERAVHVFHLPFPSTWSLKKELGEGFMSIGCCASALELFQQLEMWEEAVDCYRVMQKRSKAEELIRERLEVDAGNANLWCLLGDVTDNAGWYERAWEVSNHRSGRSQRSLGRVAFSKGDWEAAIAHFKLSVGINPLYKSAWFLMACAELKLNRFEPALVAFTRVVQIDPEDSDSWNNIAAINIKLGKKPEAWVALQEGLRQRHESWRMWQNFLHVSMDIGKFQHAISALNVLMDLKPDEKEFDTEILELLVKVMERDLPVDDSGAAGAKSRLQRSMGQLLGRIASKTSTNPELWRVYGRYHRLYGSLDKELDCLMKRFRSLQSSGWEADAARFELIVGAVHDALVFHEEHPGAASKTALYGTKLAAERVAERAKELHGKSEPFSRLQCLLPRLSACWEKAPASAPAGPPDGEAAAEPADPPASPDAGGSASA
eukprot:tig00000448_g856.t1